MTQVHLGFFLFANRDQLGVYRLKAHTIKKVDMFKTFNNLNLCRVPPYNSPVKVVTGWG